MANWEQVGDFLEIITGNFVGEEPPTGFWEKLSDHVVQGAS